MKKNKTILIITILLLAVAAYFMITQRKGTIREELKDFAIADTGSITKIFLADKFGNQSVITKETPGKWLVNGKYPARNDAVNTLLYTMKNMEMRSPVGKAGYNTVMKLIAAKGIKVEIYQNDKLSKVYYVGSATDDQLGTFMYLENSSVPFVLHIPGFDGYLTTRYITKVEDWKMHTVFNYQPDEIKTIISENFQDPLSSFMISKQENGEYGVSTYPGRIPVTPVEQNKILTFLSAFGNINYEGEVRGMKQAVMDSIRNANPFRALTITDTKNQSKKIRFFFMSLTEKSKQLIEFENDSLPIYDRDRMYALIDNDTTLVKVQHYVFGKFFKSPADFMNVATGQKPKNR